MRTPRTIPRKHCFTIAIACLVIVIAIALLFCMGCVTTSDGGTLQCAPTCVTPVCRHKAVYCAVTWSNLMREAVRIAAGPVTDGRDARHAQAQAQNFRTGKWHWLSLSGGKVCRSGQDCFFEPDKYETVSEYLHGMLIFNAGLQVDSFGVGAHCNVPLRK